MFKLADLHKYMNVQTRFRIFPKNIGYNPIFHWRECRLLEWDINISDNISIHCKISIYLKFIDVIIYQNLSPSTREDGSGYYRFLSYFYCCWKISTIPVDNFYHDCKYCVQNILICLPFLVWIYEDCFRELTINLICIVPSSFPIT